MAPAVAKASAFVKTTARQDGAARASTGQAASICGVWGWLCDVMHYTSAQPLDLTQAIHGLRSSGSLEAVQFRYPAELSLTLQKIAHF